MRDLEKSAEAGVKEAAIMLKVIARGMVSRKYSKNKTEYSGRGQQWDSRQVQVERNIPRLLARRRFRRSKESFREILQEAAK
jgi:hypothetical protein